MVDEHPQNPEQALPHIGRPDVGVPLSQTTEQSPRTPGNEAEPQHETREHPPETQDTSLDGAISGLRKKLRLPKKQKTTKMPQVRDEVSVRVEQIMEEGLKEAFQELTPVQRQEFKIKGEETALKIRDILRASHVRVKRIFQLLFEWLKMLPGINRFFLEQEAKIKADKIMTMREQAKAADIKKK